MTERLAPYGSEEQACNVAKVGKTKTPGSLVARMPSAEIAAKVGGPVKLPSPGSLAARMPSAEIAAKVGITDEPEGPRMSRVIRRNARN